MFAAVPMGVFLYFVIIVLWVWAIELLAFPVLLIPHVGSRIMGWLAFSHGVIPLIAAMAVTMELWFCRILIRRHHRVFAYTQALLGLSSHAKESRYFVPTCARISVTLWQSVSKFR